MEPLSLLRGQLLQEHPSLPFTLRVELGDVRPRFLPKGQAGNGYRAVARNGRILIASDRPLADLIGQEVRLRIQVWHRAILAGDRPEPYGLLLCIRSVLGRVHEPLFSARLISGVSDSAVLALDVGGGNALAFFPFRRNRS